MVSSVASPGGHTSVVSWSVCFLFGCLPVGQDFMNTGIRMSIGPGDIVGGMVYDGFHDNLLAVHYHLRPSTRDPAEDVGNG